LATGLVGLGCSVSFGVLILVVQNAFPYRLLGTSNSIRIFGVNLAQAIGIPALLLLTLAVLRAGLAARLSPDEVSAATAIFLRDPQAAAFASTGHSGLSQAAADALRIGLTSGIRGVFLALTVICAGAFLASLFLPGTSLAEAFDEDDNAIGGPDLVLPA
jgi:hypothetical protein